MLNVLYWDKLPFKFYAKQGVKYSDTITLYQDEDATIPIDLSGCTFTGTLRYEYDRPIIANLVFENFNLSNGQFDQTLSVAELDELIIEGYRVSLILDVLITFPSLATERYYGYLIVERR